MAIYCHECGTGLPPSAHFCSNCGTAIPFDPAAQFMHGRPLVRPRVGRQVAGVCIALARSNGWDVAVVRIITVLGFIFSGGFVGIAYLAGWIGIPEEPLLLPGSNPGPNSGAYPPAI